MIRRSEASEASSLREKRRPWTIMEYQYHHYLSEGEWIPLEELAAEYDRWARENAASPPDRAPTLDRLFQEHRWTFGENALLDRALNAYLNGNPLGEGAYAWAVTMGMDGCRVILGGQQPDPNDLPSFGAHIERLGCDTFFSLAGAVELYVEAIQKAEAPITGVPAFEAEPLVDEMLRDSFGIILWQYQLENVCGLFTRTRPEAVELRRHLNQKRADAWDRAEKMLLPSGRPLAALLDERLLFGGAVPGHWRESMLLWRLLS